MNHASRARCNSLPPVLAQDTVSHRFELTDVGNAERLVALHGDVIRYVENRWFIWDRRRWFPDNGIKIQEIAKHTVKQMQSEVDFWDGVGAQKTVRQLKKWRLASENVARIEALIRLAKSDPRVYCESDSFDRDPWLLNVENGTIDLLTGTIAPHDPAKLLTKMAPIRFEPTARCPRFLAFLNRIFQSDATLVAYVQKLLGYCLTGDTSEQYIHIFHGHGANGKSVLMSTVMAILGKDYAKQVDPKSFMDRGGAGSGARSDLAQLEGVRLVASSESATGNKLDSALMKQISGGEKISARMLYKNECQFQPQFKVLISTNHRPVIRDGGQSMWRRLRVVPFSVTIPEAERVANLTELLLEEREGIFAWLIKGVRLYREERLSPVPDVVLAATQDYREEMDVMGEFFKDCLVAEEGSQCRAQDLYDAYREWSRSKGRHVDSQVIFARHLSERGLEKKRQGPGIFWLGLRLRTLARGDE